ncbi:hypothetical protein [Paraburkholderia bannensis]|uniref:hypothetical protein n=1 Tax=Paraburkholderia bannensis TaxID=765414 RepID=UPI002AB7D057|nr:hypothetical protein [Paraburkholderia bannensis]
MSVTQEAKSFHMSLDVKGALKNWKKSEFRGMFKRDDGKTMSADEAQSVLLDELSKGHNFIPYGCCDNFDHKEHGCMGHPVTIRGSEIQRGKK